MVSREQLEAMLSRVRTSISHFGPSDYGSKLREDEAILTLSLKALDTERDAALGAAVRAHLPRHVKGDAYERPESIVGEAVRWLKFGVPALGDGWIVKMLEAIAAHLRDEQKGGG